MDIQEALSWLQERDFADAIAESTWLFPTIETLHVIALTLVVGTIGMVDLRLLGVARRDRPITEVIAEVLPWTWTTFICAVITGFLLFSSAAVKYWGALPFRLKMLLLVLAGLNMMFFHVVTFRGVKTWDRMTPPPTAVRIAGGLSLCFWIGIVACGRWIGFVTN